MDSTRFDILTRQFSQPGWTRRGLARVAAGGLVAALGLSVAAAGPAEIEAKHKHHKHKKKCKHGKIRCGRHCVDTQRDNANCGGCGRRCTPTDTGVERICQSGTCFVVGTCPADTPLCIATPPFGTECGTQCLCGTSTEGNTLCFENNTVFCTTLPPSCQSSSDCDDGEACVDVAGCCGGALPPGSRICLAACANPTPPA